MSKHISKNLEVEIEGKDVRVDIAEIEGDDVLMIQDAQDLRQTRATNLYEGEVKQLYELLQEWFEEESE